MVKRRPFQHWCGQPVAELLSQSREVRIFDVPWTEAVLSTLLATSLAGQHLND